MLVSFDPNDPSDVAGVLALIAPATAEAPEPTPVAEAAAEITPTAGVETDANGTPWLEEVHATTKTKTANGVWKKKRGIEDEVVAQAEAAARQKIAGTPQPTIPTEPVVEEEEKPQRTCTEEDVFNKWQEGLQAGVVSVAGAPELYKQLGIEGPALAHNETFRAKLYDHVQEMLDAQPTTGGIPGMP